MDGWAPCFLCKRGKQLLGAQAGPGRPFSLEPLLWVALVLAGGMGDQPQVWVRLPSCLPLKVNLSRSRDPPQPGTGLFWRVFPGRCPHPGKCGPSPKSSSAGQTVAHINRPLQPNLGRGGVASQLGSMPGKTYQSHLGRCRESTDKVQRLFMIKKKISEKTKTSKELFSSANEAYWKLWLV